MDVAAPHGIAKGELHAAAERGREGEIFPEGQKRLWTAERKRTSTRSEEGQQYEPAAVVIRPDVMPEDGVASCDSRHRSLRPDAHLREKQTFLFEHSVTSANAYVKIYM